MSATGGPRGWIAGFDIGGTFTDFVAWSPTTGRIAVHKVLTTAQDPARGAIDGLTELLRRLESDGGDLALAIHGTTLITNALIERKGARTGLVTTQGFRDTLEIGTEGRYDAYNLNLEKPAPLAPRPLRRGVPERLDKAGAVIRPLDLDAVRQVGRDFAAAGVEAVAVLFLHSFTNPAHERAARDALAELGEFTISISSEVAPEIREYQRTSTTVANAYVQPLAERYLRRLVEELRELGYGRQLYLMLSSGGITDAATARRFPIRLVESGPAAGALVASYVGNAIGRRDLLAFDMGGTTAKLCLISGGRPGQTNTFEVARVERFMRGSGLPIQVPAIELIEIGAGGGSIARLDEMGLLKVGPQSAGADPGPACYGRTKDQGPRTKEADALAANSASPLVLGPSSLVLRPSSVVRRPTRERVPAWVGEATVTDADLLLGYLNPEYFLGGRMRLDRAAAERAIRERVAEPLGIDVVQAARGIFEVVTENMVAATKVHVAERGHDPRSYALFAFGGAGPVHAYALARALKLREVICPRGAGVASAFGFLTAPVAFEFARSVLFRPEGAGADLGQLEALFAELEAEGRATLREAGVPDEAIRFERWGDLRHRGQGHEIKVRLPTSALTAGAVAVLRERFYETYAALYGHAHRDVPIELLTCRVVASGPEPKPTLARVAPHRGSAESARKSTRPAYFSELGEFVETPVYDRGRLGAGAEFGGPAVVEEAESTTVVGPHATVRIDDWGNLLMMLG